MQKEDNFYRPLFNLKEIINQTGLKIREDNACQYISFQEAMKDVKKIKWTKTNIVKRPPKKEAFSLKKYENIKMEDLLNENVPLNVVNLPEYMEGYEVNINPIIIEKLRNGEFSIQRTLDLHGHNKDEARVLFEDFIKDAVRLHLNCIRVIHGRGLKSRNEPVLKESLVRWLIQAMNRKWVLAFASCKMCDGGPGATYILLKKKANKKKLSIIK